MRADWAIAPDLSPAAAYRISSHQNEEPCRWERKGVWDPFGDPQDHARIGVANFVERPLQQLPRNRYRKRKEQDVGGQIEFCPMADGQILREEAHQNI